MVFLVRHGAHDLLGRKVAGRMPGVTLNDEGRVQAGRAARRLAREPIAALYSGPLERARETAAPISAALGLAAMPAETIDELDYGEWTGRDLAALDGDERWQAWNHHRAASRIPGGETMAEVGSRGAAAIETWRRAHPDAAVAATSHGDLIRAVVCRVLDLSYDRIHAFDVDPGSVTTLVVWEGGGKLLTLNEHPLAPELAA